jgi:hypothetical protein
MVILPHTLDTNERNELSKDETSALPMRRALLWRKRALVCGDHCAGRDGRTRTTTRRRGTGEHLNNGASGQLVGYRRWRRLLDSSTTGIIATCARQQKVGPYQFANHGRTTKGYKPEPVWSIIARTASHRKDDTPSDPGNTMVMRRRLGWLVAAWSGYSLTAKSTDSDEPFTISRGWCRNRLGLLEPLDLSGT